MKKPRPNSIDALTPAQREQLHSWLEPRPYTEISDLTEKHFGHRISPAALCRYRNRLQDEQRLQQRARLNDEAFQKTYEQMKTNNPDIPIDEQAQEKILLAAASLVIVPNDPHTPDRLLKLQRLLDYPVRRDLALVRSQYIKNQDSRAEERLQHSKERDQAYLSLAQNRDHRAQKADQRADAYLFIAQQAASNRNEQHRARKAEAVRQEKQAAAAPNHPASFHQNVENPRVTHCNSASFQLNQQNSPTSPVAAPAGNPPPKICELHSEIEALLETLGSVSIPNPDLPTASSAQKPISPSSALLNACVASPV